VHPEKMQAALDPAMLATDLADYLVAKGLPFRQAHNLTGQAVQLAAKLGKDLASLTLEEYQSLDPLFDPEVFLVFDMRRSIARHNSFGGTAPAAVQKQLQNAQEGLRKPVLV
jgi:argininosuccinate lyase